jgi:hypothetical protein
LGIEPSQVISMPSTALYRAVIAEVRRQIALRGWTMWQCDERSGVQEGYTAKALHPDTPSGRQSRWETLQLLVDALFPGGLTVRIQDEMHARASMPKGLRNGYSEEASKMAYLRARKLSPARRKKIAKRAANERWRRQREAVRTEDET